MSFRTLAAAVLFAAATQFGAAQPVDNAADGKRTAAILDRLKHANQWRDHVMLVGHRGGVRENGRPVRLENSLAAIYAAIDLGLEMVELDVQKTRDGTYVVLHDSWLDRTTTCKGRLLDRSLSELAECRLTLEGALSATDEKVPTLRQALLAAKDRILINIDNKLETSDLAGMVAIARDLGMEEQIVIKQNLWNTAKVKEVEELLTGLDASVNFMPIIADDAITEPEFVEEAVRAVGANAVELINWRREAGPVTKTGGVLFSPRARAVATRNDLHLWVNTYAIVNKPGGYLAGGRGDELATVAANPDDVFGFWIDRGATIIQTDEPKAALEWLEANGYRRAYEPLRVASNHAGSVPSQ